MKIINIYNDKYTINKISNIESFNLKFSHLRNYSFKNILSFGDLLHKVHPLAGQGLNMTIRDIKSLNKILDKYIKLGIDDGEIIAQKFQDSNKHLNFMYGVGIDSLILFSSLITNLKICYLNPYLNY